MLGDLFTPVETPEAQNRGFLKGLFGGSGQAFDREELCKWLFVFFFFFPETGTQDLLLLSSRNGVVHKIYMIGG